METILILVLVFTSWAMLALATKSLCDSINKKIEEEK